MRCPHDALLGLPVTDLGLWLINFSQFILRIVLLTSLLLYHGNIFYFDSVLAQKYLIQCLFTCYVDRRRVQAAIIKLYNREGSRSALITTVGVSIALQTFYLTSL